MGECFAPFRRDEIVLGPLLGSGEFSDVYEIKSFSLPEDNIQKMSVKGSTKRLHMKKRQKYHQTNKARYALKRMKVNYLKDSLKKNSNSDAYVQAAR